MSDASNIARKSRGKPFAAGNPGGPGRPVGSRNNATILLDRIAETDAGDVLRGVITAAKAGDLRAAEIVLARAWPVRKGRPVTFDLPETLTTDAIGAALDAVLRATADGAITPDEAAAVAAVLEVRRKSIEQIDIEARLAALEGQARE